MLGRQEGAGTQLPSNKGGLYGVPGAGGLTSEAPIVDVPPGVDPDFYARQIGANPNAILQQPLPGSVPPSPPQGMVSSVGSAIGNAASAIGNAASDVAGAVGDAASGAFDSTRNFLNTLTGGDQGGGDPGAGM
ncbi:MAG TPA: hypothetical protein VJR70_02905, partial [Stellaceae bacterium]|nr:hypothetical protein [Stellaceae bacterium]